MDLGVTVLAGLGSTHFDDFARTAFNHDESVFSQGGTLHRISGRCAGIGTLKGVLVL